MDSLITTHPVNIEIVATTPIYLAAGVTLDPQWSVQIAPTGTLVAAYDHYENAHGGAAMSILWADKYIKGVGRTPLISDPSLATGRLSRHVGCREALFTLLSRHCFDDAPQLSAVLEDTQQYALVVRTLPLRLAHFAEMQGTWQDKLAVCKAHYHLTQMEDDAFREHMLVTILGRLGFWFFRRVQFGRVQSDSIDIFGNIVRHEHTHTKADFRNTYISADKALLWDTLEDAVIVIHFILDNLTDGDTLTNSVTAQHYFDVLTRVMQQQAIQLLGLSPREVQLLSHADPELTRQLGQAIIDYLREDTDITGDAADALWAEVEIGHNFREDFVRIVKGMSLSTDAADVIARYYRQVGQSIPVRTTAWLQNCRDSNTDISDNVNIFASAEQYTAAVLASKIGLGQLIFAASIGKEAV